MNARSLRASGFRPPVEETIVGADARASAWRRRWLNWKRALLQPRNSRMFDESGRACRSTGCVVGRFELARDWAILQRCAGQVLATRDRGPSWLASDRRAQRFATKT